MTDSTKRAPRKIFPGKWATLTAGGAALGMAVAGVTHAGTATGDVTGNPTAPIEKLWLAQTEGGEGGEGGMASAASPEMAYLGNLSLLEGHMKGAVMLYARGLSDEAVGLAGHPEAEIMDTIREDMAARSAQDFTPKLEAVGSAMAEGAPLEDVQAAMNTLSEAIGAARGMSEADAELRMDEIVDLVRAAADEYESSIENGAVTDQIAFYEARGFIEVARDRAAGLTADPEVSGISEQVIDALAAMDGAFDPMSAGSSPQDAVSIIRGAAAKIELLGYKLR
ncbi:hypothetical protein OEW28_18430 [Defluviimonas sp. WL0002]|uniref:DUF305 domain-containing protein n=1 Tax=Albidovulum marisflavi TaxID=2984159 RepID=A0ABT2ZHI1_9RHOB|nr:hypothetical protein [Defluviimonas sp. WL0002]MCV2870593.1 hypothetical protein [Defluviimonas sp. WL0002]